MSAMTSNSRVAGQSASLPRGGAWAAYAAFSGFVLVALAMRLPDQAVLAFVAAAVALGMGALVLRVRSGLVLPLMVAAAVCVGVLANGSSSNVGWFAIPVLGGWSAMAVPRWHTLLFLAGALVAFGGEALWVELDPGWVAWAAGTICAVLAALLVRHNRALVRELRAAQAGLAERARAEERNRIARELHDIIGHSLTVSLLHVASARMAVQYDPQDAVRALTEAERLGRETLDEVRATVSLLRAEGEAGDGVAAPLPGLGGFTTLVDRFCAAGSDVRWTLQGDPALVPATTGLAVHRIAQEALTNAAKHAPGTPVTLEVTVEADTIELVVDSGGPPVADRGAPPGMGLDGMRERAESLGGNFTAGRRGTGWRVRALLPLRARRLPQTAS